MTLSNILVVPGSRPGIPGPWLGNLSGSWEMDMVTGSLLPALNWAGPACQVPSVLAGKNGHLLGQRGARQSYTQEMQWKFPATTGLLFVGANSSPPFSFLY